MMGYFFLLIAVTLNTLANTMMKMGAKNIVVFKEYGLFHGLFKNYTILIGIALFAMNIIFYILALSKINLSVAYPIMTVGGLILITVISYAFFKEVITPLQITGLILLIIGIGLIAGKY